MSIPCNFSPMGTSATTSGLPVGYLAADFLEGTGEQYIDTDVKTNELYYTEISAEIANVTAGYSLHGTYHVGGYSLYIGFAEDNGLYEAWGIRYSASTRKIPIDRKEKFYKMKLGKDSFSVDDITIECKPTTSFEAALQYTEPFFLFARYQATNHSRYAARIKSFEAEGKFALKPCIDPHGIACLFDKVRNKAFYNSGTGSFIVGFETVSSARRLARLPVVEAGELTVSLPAEARDAASMVPTALSIAASRGWTIIEQYRD